MVLQFFALSGFLMGYLYMHKDFNRTNVTKYALARVARIFPLYAAALLAATATWNGGGSLRFLKGLLFVNLQIEDDLRLPEQLGHLWTISVEVQYYVLFVLVWAAARRSRPHLLAVIAVLALLLLLGAYDSSLQCDRVAYGPLRWLLSPHRIFVCLPCISAAALERPQCQQ